MNRSLFTILSICQPHVSSSHNLAQNDECEKNSNYLKCVSMVARCRTRNLQSGTMSEAPCYACYTRMRAWWHRASQTCLDELILKWDSHDPDSQGLTYPYRKERRVEPSTLDRYNPLNRATTVTTILIGVI